MLSMLRAIASMSFGLTGILEALGTLEGLLFGYLGGLREPCLSPCNPAPVMSGNHNPWNAIPASEVQRSRIPGMLLYCFLSQWEMFEAFLALPLFGLCEKFDVILPRWLENKDQRHIEVPQTTNNNNDGDDDDDDEDEEDDDEEEEEEEDDDDDDDDDDNNNNNNNDDDDKDIHVKV